MILKRIPPLASLILLVLIWVTPAMALDADERERKANEFVEQIDEVSVFLEEVDATLVNARDGHYGSISRENFDQLILSRNTIVRLLKGHAQATELEPEERIEVYNAQEQMQAVIRNKPDDRVVCQRIVVHGSRFTKYECMTVAERELRAEIARENTERFQRPLCIRGSGYGC